MKNLILFICLPLVSSAIFTGCSSFLDVKSDEKLTAPASLDDFQALLNGPDFVLGVAEGEVMSTDHYLSVEDFESLACQTNIEIYSWEDSPQIQICNGDGGWTGNYKNIYTANVVLEGLSEYENSQGIDQRSSSIKGQAYFVRAVNHFEIAQVWAGAYDPDDAENRLGIPLKLTADFNEATVRANLEQTFAQIVHDLELAADLLPEKQHTVRWPNRSAAWAYLARVHLYMNDFELAQQYAGKCLAETAGELIDFNELVFTGQFPFNMDDNSEVIFGRVMSTSYYSLNVNMKRVDPELYESYHENDLRKKVYFERNTDGTIRFRGSYSGGTSGLFSGPAVDEMYLILAEAYARNEEHLLAKESLFKLLSNRMEISHVFDEIEDSDVLSFVLDERRKELLFRGVRWGDVKRLNKLAENITLKRIIRNQEYILAPNDPRYSLLIPENVIVSSGIEQNPR